MPVSRRQSCRSVGATLGEVLVVIVIGAILMAILIPVFQRVRRSARLTQVDAQLRQLGQARAIYMADTDDAPLYRTQPLIETRLASSALLLNPLDPNPRGFEEMLQNWGQSTRSRKSSYVELGKWIGRPLYDLFEARRSAGWLAAPHFDHGWELGRTHFPEGFYSRLLLDGSVIRRSYREGPENRRFSAEAIFMDDKRSLIEEDDARR